MGNNITLWFIAVFALILAAMCVIIIFTGDHEHRRRHKKKRHKLRLAVYFHNHKNPFKMSVNTLTLTDTLVHTGIISVVDLGGVTYQGTLGNITVAPADPTQDIAVVDPNTPNTIDINNVAASGGTVVNILADFTSQGNTDKGVADGTVFTGLKGVVTVINDIPSTVQLSLQVNF